MEEARHERDADQASAIQIRSATPADERAALDLFYETFGTVRGPRRWRWQYAESPAGPGVVTLAVRDGEVVGAVALMRQDINYAGHRIPAGQGCDAMLAERFRGAGIFADLAAANYEEGARTGVTSVVAFPNRNSFAPTIRKLGHDRVAGLRNYYARLGIGRAAGAAADRLVRPLWRAPNLVALRWLRRRTRRALRVYMSSALPTDLEPMLRKCRAAEVLSFWKDAAYLRWRYEQHPEHEYLFHVLADAARPVGLAVVRRAGDTAAICELFHERGSAVETALLLREVVRWHGRDRTLQLVEFFGSDSGFFDSAFASAGFRTTGNTPFVMTSVALTESPVRRLLPFGANWTVVYGDTDII